MGRLKELENIIKYRKYMEAKNNLEKVVDGVINKYAFQGINYIEPWDFEYRVREFMKNFGGL